MNKSLILFLILISSCVKQEDLKVNYPNANKLIINIPMVAGNPNWNISPHFLYYLNAKGEQITLNNTDFKLMLKHKNTIYNGVIEKGILKGFTDFTYPEEGEEYELIIQFKNDTIIVKTIVPKLDENMQTKVDYYANPHYAVSLKLNDANPEFNYFFMPNDQGHFFPDFTSFLNNDLIQSGKEVPFRNTLYNSLPYYIFGKTYRYGNFYKISKVEHPMSKGVYSKYMEFGNPFIIPYDIPSSFENNNLKVFFYSYAQRNIVFELEDKSKICTRINLKDEMGNAIDTALFSGISLVLLKEKGTVYGYKVSEDNGTFSLSLNMILAYTHDYEGGRILEEKDVENKMFDIYVAGRSKDAKSYLSDTVSYLYKDLPSQITLTLKKF